MQFDHGIAKCLSDNVPHCPVKQMSNNAFSGFDHGGKETLGTNFLDMWQIHFHVFSDLGLCLRTLHLQPTFSISTPAEFPRSVHSIDCSFYYTHNSIA